MQVTELVEQEADGQIGCLLVSHIRIQLHTALGKLLQSSSVVPETSLTSCVKASSPFCVTAHILSPSLTCYWQGGAHQAAKESGIG